MKATLVVLAVPLSAEQANDTLDDLSLHGLVEPILLIDSSGNTSVLRDGQRTEVALDEHLASQRLNGVRLVAVTVCQRSGTLQVDGVADVATRLRANCSTAGIGFQAVSVIVPTGGSKAPAEAFFSDWEANLVLVPEDAAGSRGMMSVVLSDQKVPHVAISAALTIGGAWTWQESAPLDNDDVNFVQGERRASVARLAVRIVDAGDLTLKVIGAALDPDGVWPIPINAVANQDPVAVVDSLAESVGQAPEVGFLYRPVEPPQRRNPRRGSLFVALRLFFGRLWAHLRALPTRNLRVVRDEVLYHLPEIARNQIIPSDSKIFDKHADGLARLRALYATPGLNVQAPVPTPETWRTFRSVAFGLVDGGEFSGSVAGSEPQWQGQRSVIEDRSYVVVPFDGETGGFELASADISLLSSMTSAAEAPNSVGSADAMAARSLIDALAEAAADKSGRQHPKASGKEKTDEIRNELEALRSRLSSWVGQRRSTLTWKLGERIDDALKRAMASLSASSSELQEMIDEISDYDERERELMLRLRKRTALLTAVLVLFLGGFVATVAFLPIGSALVSILVFPLALVGIGWGYLSTARQEIQFEHRLKELQTRPRALLETQSQAANEIARLTHLNEQLSDWSDIVSHILHRPWGIPPEQELIEPWTAPTRILSFASGTPDVNSDQLHGETLQLRRQICAPRWLTTNYLQVVAEWRKHYSEIAAIGSEESLSPEADSAVSPHPISTISATGESLYSPRVQFKKGLASGRYLAAVRAIQVVELKTAIADDDADKLLKNVNCDVPGLNSLSPDEFLGSVVSFSPLPDFSEYFRPALPPIPSEVQRSIVGLSSAIQMELPSDGVLREVTKIYDPAERFVLAAFRLDLSGITAIDNINLVENGPEPERGGRRARTPTPDNFL